MRAFGCLVLLCAMSSCKAPEPGGDLQPDGGDAHGAAPPRVLTLPADLGERIHQTRAESRAISEQLLLTGSVSALPGGVAEISAPLPARVLRIDAAEGRTVKAGELLATLEAPEAIRVLGLQRQARARRQRAETILRQEGQLTRDRATSERALAEAQSELSTAAADEEAARLLLSTYKVSGSRVELRSPIAGVIVRANAVLGAEVANESVMFRIVNPERLVIRAEVPEASIGTLRVGDRASVIPLGREERCEGHIDSIPRSVDPVRRVVSARVALDNPCDALMEGAFVDVVLERSPAAAQRYTAVPRSALVELDGKPAVFVAAESAGKFTVRPVVVERVNTTTAFLRSGLREGETVVDRGVILLKGEWMRSALE